MGLGLGLGLGTGLADPNPNPNQTFRNRYVSVWNFRGEMVTRFEDHVLWHPDSNTSNIYITSTQDYIFSYCRRLGLGLGFGLGLRVLTQCTCHLLT